MNKEMIRMSEYGVAWIGPVFVVTYFLFWGVLGHNIPPPNMMGISAEQLVTEYYGKSSTTIGLVGASVVGLLYLPWSCLLAMMLRDDEGKMTVFSYMELTGGTLTAFVLAFCPAIMLACSVLVDSAPASTLKALHVVSWCIYDCTYMVTTVQLTGLGLYTILNKKQKIFPAWTGWAAIAVGIIFMPLVLIPYVKEGPFMVGGSWNFYIVFGTWLFGFFSPYSYFMLKALSPKGQKMELAASSGR